MARRWSNVFPGRKTEDDKPAEPESHELEMLMADSEGVQERRQRLSSEDLGRDGAECWPLVSAGGGAGGQSGGGSSTARSPLAAGGEPQPRRVCVKARHRQPTTA